MTKKTDTPAIRFKGFSDTWEQRKLGELVDVCSGRDYKHLSEGTIPVYGTGGYMLSVNDALSYDRDAIGIGRKGTIDRPYILKAPFWTVDTLFYAIPREKVDLNFAFDIFQNIDWKKKDESTGVPSLSKTAINDIDVLAPKHDEQQTIGQFFAALDDLITLHQRKYEKLHNIKKSMLEKMFPKNGSNVPEIRFKGFTEAWEQRKAKELFVSTADKGYPELPVLSATQDRGMIRRDENSINIFHDKKNEAGYKRVLPGQFVIHLRSFQGGFAHSAIEGITSPAYTVFGFSEPEKHDSEYWKYVFTSKSFIRRLETVTYGIRDGRSISYEEFLTLGFVYPSKAEQTAIARYLDKLSDLITLHQRELEKLQNIKKSMLEKMFV